MSKLVWLHEDALRETHPVLANLSDNDVVFMVWDNDYFKQTDYGYNRLAFIYEAMSSLPFDFYEGSVVDIIRQLGLDKATNQLKVPKSSNIYLRQICDQLHDFSIDFVADEPFVVKSKVGVEKRFFRYWNKVKKQAFLHGGTC